MNSGYWVLIIHLLYIISGINFSFCSFFLPSSRFLFMLLLKSGVQTREEEMYSSNLLLFIVSKSFKIQVAMRDYGQISIIGAVTAYVKRYHAVINLVKATPPRLVSPLPELSCSPLVITQNGSVRYSDISAVILILSIPTHIGVLKTYQAQSQLFDTLCLLIFMLILRKIFLISFFLTRKLTAQ